MMKTIIKRIGALFIITVMTLCAIPVFGEETVNIKFVGGQVEVAGSISQATPSVLVTAVVLEKGVTKETFLSGNDFFNAYTMIHTFWQTETDASGKFNMSIPLKADIELGDYVVLVDSSAFGSLKSQTVTAVGLDTIKATIAQLDSATEQSAVTQILLDNAQMFDIDTTKYASFSLAGQKIVNDVMIALDLSDSDVYTGINTIRNAFFAYQELVLFNNAKTSEELIKVIQDKNNYLGLDLTIYEQLNKNNFASSLLEKDYTDIAKLRGEFLKDSILYAFNSPILAGTLKEIVETYTDVIGVSVNDGSDYSKVTHSTLFKNVVNDGPFKTISELKSALVKEISNLLKPSSSSSDSSGSDRTSGGGGGGSSMKFYDTPGKETTDQTQTPADTKQGFADVQNHWAKDSINEMYQKGYINGKDKNNFAPDSAITRAEFVSIISRVLNLSSKDSVFADVSENDWYYTFVNGAAQQGIISMDETFRPNSPITRQEIIKILVSVYEYKQGEGQADTTISFADSENIASWAKSYINTAVGLGLVNGSEENGQYYIKPLNNATRAEATVTLKRLTDLILK